MAPIIMRQPGRIIRGEMNKRLGDKVLTIEEEIATVDNVTLDDVNAHRAKYFVAPNLRIAIAGDLSKSMDKIKDIINQFDELGDGARPKIIDPDLRHVDPFTIVRKESRDIIVRLDVSSNDILSERERAAANLLTDVMSGGFYSILFGSVRDKGLAYNPRFGMSGGDLGYGGGLQYSTGADRVLPAIDACIEQLQSVKQGKLSDEIVQYCKDVMTGEFEMGGNTCGAIHDRVGSSYMLLDKVRDPMVRINAIKSLTKDDVVAAINKLFSQPAWGLCLYGNTDQALTDQVAERVKVLFE